MPGRSAKLARDRAPSVVGNVGTDHHAKVPAMPHDLHRSEELKEAQFCVRAVSRGSAPKFTSWIFLALKPRIRCGPHVRKNGLERKHGLEAVPHGLHRGCP